MLKEQLNRLCTRIRLIDGDDILSNGSGTIIYYESKYYVFTAYHCIYGENNIYQDIKNENIKIEIQNSFNSPMTACIVKSVVCSNEQNDWVLLEVDMDISNYPQVINVIDFTIDAEACFRGFQRISSDEGRTFDCMVKEPLSQAEFKVTLGPNEQFQEGAEDAKGLSGSGVFILQNETLHLIGILRSVKGSRAINEDILCCSVTVLKELFPNNFGTIANIIIDNHGAEQFEEILISDSRNIVDKIRNVCQEMTENRVKKYCTEIALGKSELAPYNERSISAMKFRIFHACQDELIEFTELRDNPKLTVQEVKDLLKKFTEKAIAIIETKSATYTYPIRDHDIIYKIVLELINECYLAFDKEGVYEY